MKQRGKKSHTPSTPSLYALVSYTYPFMELDLREFSKSIYVITDAGKPVFSWNETGDALRLSSLLKAILSFCEAMGDSIRCMKSGRTRIMFLVKHQLSFIIVSETGLYMLCITIIRLFTLVFLEYKLCLVGEPEAALIQQLEFVHSQMMFVLTGLVCVMYFKC